MTDDTPLDTYFESLTAADRAQLEERMERHRNRLESEGYEVAIADGEHGFFAGILVIDDDAGRVGFLGPDGGVNWLTDGVGGFGALGDAVAQNPSERLQSQVEGLDNVNVE